MNLTNELMRRSITGATLQSHLSTLPDREAFISSVQSFESLLGRYNRVQEAALSVEHLSREFFAESKGVVSEHQARLYEFSVESIFRAAGEELPASEFAPSFEKSTDYSTEAGEKVASTLQRLGAWLMELLRKIGEGLTAMIGKFKNSTTAGKARLVALRDKIKAGKDEKGEKKGKSEPSNEAANETVPVDDVKILGGPQANVGTTVTRAQDAARKAGTDMLSIVRAVSESVKRFDPVKHSSKGGLDDFIEDLMSSVGMERGDNGGKKEFPIGHGPGAVIEFSKKSDSTVKAKASKIEYKKTPGNMPSLDHGEVMNLLNSLIEAYDKVDAMNKPMETVATVFSQMSKSMNDSYKKIIAEIKAATTEEEISKLSQTSRVYSTLGQIMQALANLPSSVLSSYMQTQWAADNYAHKAARG